MDIHRHTGGLENLVTPYKLSKAIHRHTGGLENSDIARS